MLIWQQPGRQCRYKRRNQSPRLVPQVSARPSTRSPDREEITSSSYPDRRTFKVSLFVSMDEYLEADVVQRQDNTSQMAVVSSFPIFPVSYTQGPWFYPGNLLPNATTTTTTTITAQMDPQPSRLWTNAASISVGHPGLPSPQQASFGEYWQHIDSQPSPQTPRHDSPTTSALSGGRAAHDTIRPGPTSSSYPVGPPSMVSPTPLHHATRYIVPQLHLNTAGLEQGHGSPPTFLSPSHTMNLSPSANTRRPGRNSDNIWMNEHSPVETRAMVLARSHHATTGVPLVSGSSLPLPLWHTVPRLGQPLPPFPRWNHQLSSSTWIPQMAPESPLQPHTQQPSARPPPGPPPPPTLGIMPPPSSVQHPPHPHPHTPPLLTSSEIPHVGYSDATGAGYAYPAARMMADINPTPPPRPTTVLASSVDRIARPGPAISVRRRSSLSTSLGGTNVVKRKPLPKIYGCDGCGKKFDRPSTLKVHEAIHTGAKDHLCEYCMRAFTVQSNMKRHMRVCKHKPLSPPMSLCYIISTALPFPPPTALRFPAPFQAMQIDRSNSMNLSGGGGPSSSTNIHPSIPTASNRSAPMIETAAGTVQMLPFENPLYLPQSQSHHGPPPTVKGHKAPMIIAAMFSVQQNVPPSLAKFTLVHLECDIPLPPVMPHPEYVGLYPDANGFTAKIIEQPKLKEEPPIYSRLPEARYSQSSFASSSTSLPSTLHSAADTVSTAVPDVEPHKGDREESPPLEFYIDPEMRTKGLSALPEIRYEERNSYYPRSRYCYHPAEFDPIGLLPGPGIVDLPEEVPEYAPGPSRGDAESDQMAG